MEILIQASQFLLSLSLLIVLHEFGHFIPARLFKTRVEKFYLFFDYKWSLFKKKVGETEWGIGWIPLGGYVKISGMIDESMDTEQMAAPAQPWEFRSKPAWQRLIIMLGGVTVNLILGFLIYSMIMWAYGEKRLPMAAVDEGVMVSSELGYEVGFQDGDKILSLDGRLPEYFGQLNEELFYSKEVKVEREGQEMIIAMPEDFAGQFVEKKERILAARIPLFIQKTAEGSANENVFKKNDRILTIAGESTPYYDQARALLKKNQGQKVRIELERDGERMTVEAAVDEKGALQVLRKGLSLEEMEHIGLYKVETHKYGFFESFPAGWNKTVKSLSSYVRQFSLIFDFKSGAYKGIGGFGAIGSLFSTTWNWQSFWNITAFLSIMLAFMNLLPIPALDGGHVMFLLYEMISGREPNQKLMEYAQMVGIILLLALLLFANGNDVLGMFKK